MKPFSQSPARTGAALLSTMVALCLSGCATNENYDQGNVFLAARDYDQAVTALRAVVTREPHNNRYLSRLSEAETLAADRHVERAKYLLE